MSDPRRLVVGLYGQRLGVLIGDDRRFDFEAERDAIHRFGLGSTILSESVPLNAVTQRTGWQRRQNFFVELLPEGDLLDLLAAEILARTGKDPGVLYQELTSRFGAPLYTRIDQPANAAQKAALKKLSPDAVKATSLAGEPILARLTKAPGNNADIGGLKVVAENGWFAARPSGTEDVYKIYAESFRDQRHLDGIVDEARAIVSEAFRQP